MLAADTNVVVRLLVDDDEAQQRRVVARLEQARRQGVAVLVTNVVLAEVSWVLEAVYGYGRDAVADALDALVTTEPFVCEAVAEVREAVRRFRAGPADFADYLVLGRATRLGARTLLTFDKRLARDAHCEVP